MIPSNASKLLVLLALVAFAGPGCAHIPLRHNTISQARTLADIHQQQVLNNLAAFAHDPNAMPCFAYPTQGTNQVTNTTSGNVSNGFSLQTAGPRAGHFLFNSIGLSVNGQYQSNEAFTLIPINDPRKLELMRCAYQRAMTACYGGGASTTCPDCQARTNVFYTGDPQGNVREKANGIVNPACMNSTCWFHVGCHKCLPKHCDCIPMGHHCGTYVWVMPEGQDELTKLTLAILDYAMHDPPVRITKEVTYYLDEHGLPTTQGESVGKVVANIAVNERNESLIALPPKEESSLEQQLKSELDNVTHELAQADLTKTSPYVQGLLNERKAIQSKLEYLKNQSSIEGLMNEFVPRDQTMLGPATPGPISPNILQAQQLLQQIKSP